MKKRLLLVVVSLFFLFLQTGYAETRIGFDSDLKSEIKIIVEKNEIIEIPVYYETDDYDLYVFLADFDYDENRLELMNYIGDNDFNITIGEKILVDRTSAGKKNGKMFTLSFKSKKSGTSDISIKNIEVGDLKETKTLDSINAKVKIKYDYKILLYGIGILIIIGASIYFIVQKKRWKKGRK